MESSSSPPRIAYLTNQYPSVSHTFIRREIRALEALGYSISRWAVRPGGAAVDPADQDEARQTFHILAQPKAKLILAAMGVLAGRPGRAWQALRMTRHMSHASDRGFLRHLAYLLEAATLLPRARAEKIEHVHVHFGTNSAAVARLLHALGGPRYSMTIHGPDELDAPIGLSLGAKMLDAAFTVAITDYCASQLRRWIPFDAWKTIHIVHCTVGPDWFSAAAPMLSEADALVCVGRLSPQKGQLVLLEAFAAARAAGASGRLVLIGDGEMRGIVEERIGALGLGDSVALLGWQDEARVRSELLQARALVLGSFAEGLPVVIMEAMALGRPVIATRIMGIPELVEHGSHGWLVTPGNVEQLATAMQEALSTPLDLLQAMGDRGRAAVAENHTAEQEALKLDALFRAAREESTSA